MAVKAIIEKLEDVPEAIRGEYRPGTKEENTEGKFVLDVVAVSGFSLEDVTGLKTALGRERTAAQTAAATLSKFVDGEGKTLDPTKVVTALQELETLKQLDPTKQADELAKTKFENLKTQLVQAHQAELDKLTGRTKQLTNAIDSLVVDSEAVKELATAKGSVDLLLPHVRNQTRTKEIEVEGKSKFVTEVIDKDGNVRVNGKAEPMSLAELIAEMREAPAFARAFEGDGQTGGGTQEDQANNNTQRSRGGDFSEQMGASRPDRTQAIAKRFNLPVR